MKRLIRWSFNTMAGLCLLLCLAVGWLWWRTRRVAQDKIVLTNVGKSLVVESEPGYLILTVRRGWPEPNTLNFTSCATDDELNGQCVEGAREPPGAVDPPGVAWRWRNIGYDYQAFDLYTTVDGHRAMLSSEWTGIEMPRVSVKSWDVYAPHWVIAAPLGAVPLAWLGVTLPRAVILGRRRRKGQCVGCGYDLRATPGRCPECGKMPAGMQMN